MLQRTLRLALPRWQRGSVHLGRWNATKLPGRLALPFVDSRLTMSTQPNSANKRPEEIDDETVVRETGFSRTEMESYQDYLSKLTWGQYFTLHRIACCALCSLHFGWLRALNLPHPTP